MKDIDERLYQIIEQKIGLLLDPMPVDLSRKFSVALEELKKPDDKRKVSIFIDKYIEMVRLYLIEKYKDSGLLIKDIIANSKINLSEELGDKLYKLIEDKIREDKILSKFPIFIHSIKIRISRFGIPIDKIEINANSSEVKFQVMVKNLIRRNLANLKADLDLLSFPSQKLKPDKEEGTMKKVFISYSHVDSKLADQITGILDGVSIEYFRDIKAIEWGDNISLKVREGIDSFDAILVIVSPGSLKSHWVPYEIGYATAKGKKILPYLQHPSLDVPNYIKELNYNTELAQVKEYFLKLKKQTNTDDSVHKKEPEPVQDNKIKKLYKLMPDLIKEMKHAVENEGNDFIREFVILTNDRVMFNSDKTRFVYYEDKHPELKNKIDIIEQYGFITDITPGNTPIYRMSEEFVELLKELEV